MSTQAATRQIRHGSPAPARIRRQQRAKTLQPQGRRLTTSMASCVRRGNSQCLNCRSDYGDLSTLQLVTTKTETMINADLDDTRIRLRQHTLVRRNACPQAIPTKPESTPHRIGSAYLSGQRRGNRTVAPHRKSIHEGRPRKRRRATFVCGCTTAVIA
jgi:hypothetical protein